MCRVRSKRPLISSFGVILSLNTTSFAEITQSSEASRPGPPLKRQKTHATFIKMILQVVPQHKMNFHCEIETASLNFHLSGEALDFDPKIYMI